MTQNLPAILLAGALAVLPSIARADDDGVLVRMRVLDVASEAPIQTAVVRHPQEQVRHPVNVQTGVWEDSVLYMPDGSELAFAKGMALEFEVSAPGYENRRVSYTVRRRKNEFKVYLTRLIIDLSNEDPDDVTIQFGRDKPID